MLTVRITLYEYKLPKLNLFIIIIITNINIIIIIIIILLLFKVHLLANITILLELIAFSKLHNSI